MFFLSAISLGFISSFHCVGMCGPIALSLPVQYLSQHKKFTGIILYNAGRIFSYSFLGLIFGFIGQLIFIRGFANIFSIVIGTMIIVAAIAFYFNNKYLKIVFIENMTVILQRIISNHIRKKQSSGMFLIGAANGLLPCGMVYFAVAEALATGNILHGILFMLLFGLGTAPLMIVVSNFGYLISISLRNTVKKIIPYFLVLMGVLLILRGMNLGIPYISPAASNAGDSVSCPN
jgi:sulfite exporter TauE/SafE